MNIGNLITVALTGIALTAPASNIAVMNLADSGEGSLRQAVLDANTLLGSDTIHFADGLQGTIALTAGQVSITDDLTINGPGASQLALSGNYQSRIFIITGGATVALARLTIKEGWVTGSSAHGGGILNNASTLTLSQVVLTNNQAVGGSGGTALGGGVANTLGGMVIGSGVVLNQNQSFGGAGGATEDGGGGAGGGIYNDGASTHPSNPGVPTILIAAGCQITANSALGGAAGNASAAGGVGAAGALWNGGISSLKGTVINRNRAIGGDGINGGDGLGGGAYNEALSAIMLDHSSVTDNHANAGDGYNSEGIGGGIYYLGLFEPDVFSMISQNHASTSNNDIFGM